MAMVNVDLARIPAAVRDEFESCENCEFHRTPRASICAFHSGWWDGYETALTHPVAATKEAER